MGIMILVLVLILCCSFHRMNNGFYKPKRLETMEINFPGAKIQHIEGKHPVLILPTTGTPKGTIIHFHANHHHIKVYLPYVGWFTQCGYTVAMLEYPGYGIAPGKASRKSLHSAAVAFLKWAKSNLQPPFHLVGQSLGGNVAMAAYYEAPILEVCSIVVEGTFSTYQGAGAAFGEKNISILKFFSKLGISKPLSRLLSLWLVSNKRSAICTAHQLGIAFLSFHAENDPIVPVEEGKQLFLKVSSWRKKFVKLDPSQGKHIGNIRADENRKIILDFFDKAARAWGY